MVVEYGVNGDGYGDVEYERGPFFCGISCPLQFGSYAITFKGPCSTTAARSVSLNFAKRNGLILCIQNDGLLMQRQTFLNCSFFFKLFRGIRAIVDGRSTRSAVGVHHDGSKRQKLQENDSCSVSV